MSRRLDDAITAVLGTLILAFPFVLFWLIFTIGGARGQPSAIKTPVPCVRLAAQFGFTVAPTYSRDEAKEALSHLDLRMVMVRDARLCRSALKRELEK